MSRVLVTGAAGFIGSHLSEALVASGHQVVGIDNFTTYYDPKLKEQNVARLRADERFDLVNVDLATTDIDVHLEEVDVVYHLAAQPGVRLSWQAFATYVSANLLATERILAAISRAGVQHLVFASSSSVYGNAPSYPTAETSALEPRSPYGVTKLAGEKLLDTYVKHGSFTAYSMRFFTVYGPRQRPDMAIQRMLTAVARGEEFELYGDGSAIRDFTYVADVVEACRRAGEHRPEKRHLALNIGGSGGVSMRDLVDAIQSVSGRQLRVSYTDVQAGDVTQTGADTRLVEGELGWLPQWRLTDGLASQWQEVLAHADERRIAE